MLIVLKHFYWDWRDRYGRFQIISGMLSRVPGSAGMELRKRYLPRFFAACGPGIRIHEGVRIRSVHKITAGNKVTIGMDNFLQAGGGIVLGDNVILGPSVKIWSVNHRFADVDRPIGDQGYDYEEVVIGEGVWVGANAFILPGVHLPEGCVVSAGSVVGKKKYPPFSILAGYPARVVGNRRPAPAGDKKNEEGNPGREPLSE